jgi:hypothetical protein
MTLLPVHKPALSANTIAMPISSVASVEVSMTAYESAAYWVKRVSEPTTLEGYPYIC